jgi:hypothetical protein
LQEISFGHLEKEQKGKGKTQFLRLLRGADLGTWEGVHAERQRAEIIACFEYLDTLLK